MRHFLFAYEEFGGKYRYVMVRARSQRFARLLACRRELRVPASVHELPDNVVPVSDLVVIESTLELVS